MDKTYIGIDPGAKGYVCVMWADGHMEHMGLQDGGWHGVAGFLGGIMSESQGNVVCCMEEIHAVHGSSAKGTFSFGEVYGVLQGVLIALGMPYHLVPPKTWQKEIWVNGDKVWKSTGRTGKDGKALRAVDQKPTSMNAAQRLFPNVDFRRSAKCKVLDDNKCDATLICEYGRRRNL